MILGDWSSDVCSSDLIQLKNIHKFQMLMRISYIVFLKMY